MFKSEAAPAENVEEGLGAAGKGAIIKFSTCTRGRCNDCDVTGMGQ